MHLSCKSVYFSYDNSRQHSVIYFLFLPLACCWKSLRMFVLTYSMDGLLEYGNVSYIESTYSTKGENVSRRKSLLCSTSRTYSEVVPDAWRQWRCWGLILRLVLGHAADSLVDRPVLILACCIAIVNAGTTRATAQLPTGEWLRNSASSALRRVLSDLIKFNIFPPRRT